MKKTTLVLLVAGMFFFVGYKSLDSGSENPHPMSGGAPSASTGAPDEKHCATSGCHSDFTPNSGIAVLKANIGGGITEYEPGKTYPMTVSISNPGLIRFGFQVVALRNTDNTNVGTIKLLDEIRTQIMSGYGNIADRRYITYTYEGTNCVTTGLGEWHFEWTAPETNVGPITFYIGSVAANDDGTDGGDYAYSARIVLGAPGVSWNIYSNISMGKFDMNVQGLPVNVEIYNAAGTKVKSILAEPGLLNFDLNQPTGVYFLSVTQNDKTQVQKIVITR